MLARARAPGRFGRAYWAAAEEGAAASEPLCLACLAAVLVCVTGSFYGFICTLQITTSRRSFLVDCLAPGVRAVLAAKLGALLQDEAVLKARDHLIRPSPSPRPASELLS